MTLQETNNNSIISAIISSIQKKHLTDLTVFPVKTSTQNNLQLLLLEKINSVK